MTNTRMKKNILVLLVLCLAAAGAGAAEIDNVGYVYQVPEDTTTDTEYANHWYAWNTNTSNTHAVDTAYMTYNISAYGTAWSNQYAMPGPAWDNSTWQGGYMVFAFDAAQGQKIEEFRFYLNQLYYNPDRDDVQVYWSNDYITTDTAVGPLPDRSAWNLLANDPTAGSNYTFNPDSERTYLMYFLYRKAAGGDNWWTLQMRADAYRIQTTDIIPEPATMALVCMGGLAVLGRRKRK